MTAREQWYDAYRRMRIIYDSTKPPTDEEIKKFCRLDRMHFLAFARLHGRHSVDPLTITPEANLFALKLVDEILAEDRTP